MRTKKLAKRTMTIDVESVVDWTECDGCDAVANLYIVDRGTAQHLDVDRKGWGQLVADKPKDLCPTCLARVAKEIGQ